MTANRLCRFCQDIHLEQKQEWNVLELYSGIGGMHYALQNCGLLNLGIQLNVKAVEINVNANRVYDYNFGNKNKGSSGLWQRNIVSLSPEELDSLHLDICTLSPPCQPFTRQGLQLDEQDARTDSFIHLVQKVFPFMKEKPKYMLLENVKGFELSSTRDSFIKMLNKCGYTFQEFLLKPQQFSVPNSRLRYYCIAKLKEQFCFEPQDLLNQLPKLKTEEYLCENCFSIFSGSCILNTKPTCLLKNFLEYDDQNIQFVPDDKLLRYYSVFDIVNENSNGSCCFTKNYTRLCKGAGSYLQTTSIPVTEVYEKVKQLKEEDAPEKEILNELKKLKMRYFTPREVANLMQFPKDFTFPAEFSNLSAYKLLGNSVNVKVVTELFKLLFLNCVEESKNN